MPGGGNIGIDFGQDTDNDQQASLEIVRTTSAVVRALARVLGGLSTDQKHLAPDYLFATLPGAAYLYKTVLRFHLLPLSRGQVTASLDLRSASHVAASALYELAAAFGHDGRLICPSRGSCQSPAALISSQGHTIATCPVDFHFIVQGPMSRLPRLHVPVV